MSLLDVTVRIRGANFTGDTLASATIRRGREDVYTVPQPGYSNFTLIDLTGDGFNIRVTDSVEIDIEGADETGEPEIIPIFTGQISDIRTETFATVNGPRARWSITATTRLAIMNRRQILAGGAPAERDDFRAIRVLSEGLFTRWDEFPVIEWDDVPESLTWDTLDVPVAAFPGNLQLAALPAQEGGYNAYGLLAETIVSSGGSITEFASGPIAYLSTFTRRELADEVGYIAVPTERILAGTLGATQQSSNLVNVIEVGFDGGTIERTNGLSLATFGRRTSTISTTLLDEAAADARAEDILSNLGQPRFVLPTVEWSLNADPEELEAFALFLASFPIKLADLPATLGSVNSDYFVEGIEWIIGPGTVNIRFNISDARLSLNAVRFGDVNATLEWQNVSPILEWQDAREVA